MSSGVVSLRTSIQLSLFAADTCAAKELKTNFPVEAPGLAAIPFESIFLIDPGATC